MITPTALFSNPVGGLLPLHFDQKELTAARGSQDLFGQQSSMMNANRASNHDQLRRALLSTSSETEAVSWE